MAKATLSTDGSHSIDSVKWCRIPMDDGAQVPSPGIGCPSDYPRDRSLYDLFLDQVNATPDAIAIDHRGAQHSYQELDERVNRIACSLHRHGVRRRALVGLCMERSPELFAAVIAIVKIGAVYVPLDPDYPDERLSFILQDVGAEFVLTHAATNERLSSQHDKVATIRADDALQRNLDTGGAHTGVVPATHAAYVMYTSGSTGTPKGVVVSHRAIARLVCNTNYCDFGRDQVFLQLAPISFDASTFEIWGPLLNGGRLAIMPPGRLSLGDLADAIKLYGVTTLWLPSGLFGLMVDQQLDGLRPLRQLIAGGDVLSPTHVQRALDALADGVVINGYGPTESTTFACCHRMQKGTVVGKSIPIGYPVSNTTAFVLDEEMQPVPPGASGELFLGGDGLAGGYWNRPELTRDRFVSNPFDPDPSARLYRTGDLVRQRDDGALEFLGRLDQQLKVSGYRVEPGEIESALTRHPSIRQAVVVASGETASSKQLVAFVVVDDSTSASEGEIRRFLALVLPAYMLPSAIHRLDSLPLTPNGKIDRRSNIFRELSQVARPTPAAFSSDLEQEVAAIWERTLGRPVAPTENFFDLGGTSLQLISLHAQLAERFHDQLTVTDLFDCPTVRSMAKRLSRAGDSESDAQLSNVRARAKQQQAAAARLRQARLVQNRRSRENSLPKDHSE